MKKPRKWSIAARKASARDYITWMSPGKWCFQYWVKKEGSDEKLDGAHEETERKGSDGTRGGKTGCSLSRARSREGTD